MQENGALFALPSSTPNVEFLEALNNDWLQFCRSQIMIRSIFLYLDRTYVIQTQGVKSIWDMGLDVFRLAFLENDAMLDDSNSFKTRVVDALLSVIECERTGQQTPTYLLKSLISMFLELGTYLTAFETRFLGVTESFYVSEGARWIADMGEGSLNGLAVGTYLAHAEKRIDEEKMRCGMTGYLSLATRKSLVVIVERILIETHIESLLRKGFDDLIQNDRVEDLTRMYTLFSRAPNGLVNIRKYFGDYIAKVGLSIVNDVNRDPTMILDLIAFKKRMENLTNTAFASSKEFMQDQQQCSATLFLQSLPRSSTAPTVFQIRRAAANVIVGKLQRQFLASVYRINDNINVNTANSPVDPKERPTCNFNTA